MRCSSSSILLPSLSRSSSNDLSKNVHTLYEVYPQTVPKNNIMIEAVMNIYIPFCNPDLKLGINCNLNRFFL